MAQQTLPIGKQEFHDGNNWFSLASENWVLNTIRAISPCLVATTANLAATYSNGNVFTPSILTNSGSQAALSIDGVNLAVNDRVLVKNQTSGVQNGIYKVTNIGSASTNWVLTRASDYDSAAQMARGDIVSVVSGTASAATVWMLTTVITTIGTDSLTFVSVSKSGFTSIVGTTNQISVSISNGVATISLASNPVLPGLGAVTIPTGATSDRPTSPMAGMMRLNTSL